MCSAGYLCLVVILCSFAFKHAAGCEQSFIIDEVENIKVGYCGCCLHFTCDSFTGNNQMSRVNLPLTAGAGGSTSFNIDAQVVIDEISSSIVFYRVKTPVVVNLILTWNHEGGQMVPRWRTWSPDEGFRTVADSNITPGSGTHFVTLTTSSDGIVIIEDGVYLGRKDCAIEMVEMHFDMQTNRVGSMLDIIVSEIAYKPGFFSLPSMIAT